MLLHIPRTRQTIQKWFSGIKKEFENNSKISRKIHGAQKERTSFPQWNIWKWQPYPLIMPSACVNMCLPHRKVWPLCRSTHHQTHDQTVLLNSIKGQFQHNMNLPDDIVAWGKPEDRSCWCCVRCCYLMARIRIERWQHILEHLAEDNNNDVRKIVLIDVFNLQALQSLNITASSPWLGMKPHLPTSMFWLLKITTHTMYCLCDLIRYNLEHVLCTWIT